MKVAIDAGLGLTDSEETNQFVDVNIRNNIFFGGRVYKEVLYMNILLDYCYYSKYFCLG